MLQGMVYHNTCVWILDANIKQNEANFQLPAGSPETYTLGYILTTSIVKVMNLLVYRVIVCTPKHTDSAIHMVVVRQVGDIDKLESHTCRLTAAASYQTIREYRIPENKF